MMPNISGAYLLPFCCGVTTTMTGQKTVITIRVQVTIPYGSKRPQRVRVVAKDRGALVFAYRRELACVPLYKAGWRRVPGERGGWLWQNEQAVAVAVDMARLLRYRNLALQLYCLRGSDVKHKGVFNFRRVMEQQQQQQQQQQDELLLAMRYSTGWWWRCLAFTCFRRDEDEAVAVRGGSDQRRHGAGKAMVNAARAGNPCLPQTVPLPLDSVSLHAGEHGGNGPAAAQHAAWWQSLVLELDS